MKQMIIILLVSLLLLSGCGFKDLDKRFFVVAVGIDKAESEKFRYKVSLELGIPSSKIEPGQAKSQIISEEANSISEAVRHIKAEVDKEQDFGHAKILIIGESMAHENLEESLDWIFRRRDIQRIGFLAVGVPDAKAILKAKPESERVPANALFLSFGREGTEAEFIVPEFLFDFYRRLKEPGEDPYMPIIKTAKNLYIIDQVALFNKKRLKLELNSEETRIFNMLLREYHRMVIRVDESDIHYSLAIDAMSVKYRFGQESNHEPNYLIKVRGRGLMEESDHDVGQGNWKAYEEAANKTVEKNVAAFMKKLQENDVDPLGIGLHYRAVHHTKSELEDWKKLYPKIRFVVQSDVKIDGSGVIM